jgi:formate dehydrogenase accessory protein FdhD
MAVAAPVFHPTARCFNATGQGKHLMPSIKNPEDFQDLAPRGSLSLPIEEWPDKRNATDNVAEEVPVALVYNDISYAVMMATPLDLEAFALGFSLTEGVVDRAEDIYSIETDSLAEGIEIRLNISSQCFMRFKNKRRSLTGRTGCGICGVESLRQLRTELPAVKSNYSIAHSAIDHATQFLLEHQPLQGLTGAIHAAAWCNEQGNIVAACEDIGRHNAVDKLIGLLWKQDCFTRPGFLLLSSRISYEIIQKAAIARIAVVAAISAPTSLAISLAQESGIALVGFSRDRRHVVYTHHHRLST